ncbi:L-lactate dehydrogenase [Hondaea fermentalgiana]|uniref:Malate dehydrogenase n=1 Tax=Hondaea fermentalgiana TaxID=2315210 RepID=A0A2R5FZX0_9STRA|nr:L-lactate dehydrogenase [Hondaea fermentalgiana]|eukprot:GBG24290.1 L-lactate dehydrogenase [Hondaea fermentalgiana]
MLASMKAARGLASAAGAARAMSTKAATVGVVGASGGIGAPLSLLLKQSPYVGDLRLSDVVSAPVGSKGVAADLGHIDTEGLVTGGDGPDAMKEVLAGCDAVVIPAGVPRKPGMSRDDLFNTNASIVQSIGKTIAEACPNAFVLIISNPVNSTVPIMAETLKAHGVYDKRKVMGVTTLDVVRSNCFVGNELGRSMKDINVPVIGGHAGITILPLLSHIEGANFTDEQIERLSHRIAFGGDEVVQAKEGAGSATLSMAYAAARFTESLLKAAAGEKGITECAFVESHVAEDKGCKFFSTPCELGPNGVEKIGEIPALSDFEKAKFDEMIGDLTKQVNKGIDFVKNQ